MKSNEGDGNERVDHPRHYTSHPSGVEAIEICEHLRFNVGNAVKYLFRADHKGAALEDLKKAAWYLRRESAAYARSEWCYSPVEAVDGNTLDLVERVVAAEPAGSVLRVVLEHLFSEEEDYDALLNYARVRVEIELRGGAR